MGGATGHTVVGLCMYGECLSVGRISRRSLKTKRCKRATQAKVEFCSKMNCKDFGYKALFVSYCVAWFGFVAPAESSALKLATQVEHGIISLSIMLSS